MILCRTLSSCFLDISHLYQDSMQAILSRLHFFAYALRVRKIGKRSLTGVEKYPFLPRDIRGEKAVEVSKATLIVSLHPREVKNDIKFKSSLNKKSFPEARDRIIHSSEKSRKWNTRVGDPRDSRSSILTSFQTKTRNTPPTASRRRRSRRRSGRRCDLVGWSVSRGRAIIRGGRRFVRTTEIAGEWRMAGERQIFS